MDKEIKRILIVDDNESIHEDFNKILMQTAREEDVDIKELENDLFGDDDDTATNLPGEKAFPITFKADHAYQGEDSIRMVKQAIEEGFPYSLIFMDVRMPPGIDGIQAISEIWKAYPHTEIVICTAYSDYSWDQIFEKFGSTDHLLFLKKPFDSVTVKQISLTLIKKWELDRQNRLQTKKLETEISARTEELQHMLDELERLKKQNHAPFISKSGFLENISYELKTPLNGILGVTDLLLDTQLNSEQRDFARIIKSSSNSMLLMINDLLDYSNFNEGGIDLKEISFNFRTSIDYVTDLSLILTHDSPLNISTLIDAQLPNHFIGDPLRLRQILLNLVSNAVKTTQNGDITLSITNTDDMLQDKDTTTISFSVIDSHGGDSFEETYELLTAPQIRNELPADQNDYPYNILIAKELIECMGGKLNIKTAGNAGKCLFFTLNFKRDFHPGGNATLSLKSLSRLKTLIIGDNATSRKVLSLYIKHWGGDCKTADDLKQAYSCIQMAEKDDSPFDIILLDIEEEDLQKEGSIAEQLKKYPELQKVPLVYITAKAKRGDALHLKNFGYQAYLTKPIKQSHLYNCIRLIQSEDSNFFEQKNEIITKHTIDEQLDDHVRVLIVDPNVNDQKRLSKVFNQMKVRCDVTSNLKNIEKRIASGLYDLLFVTSTLAGKERFNPADAIHLNAESVKPIPVIITSDIPSSTLDKAPFSTMSAIVYKPYRFEEIHKTLKEILSTSFSDNPNNL